MNLFEDGSAPEIRRLGVEETLEIQTAWPAIVRDSCLGPLDCIDGLSTSGNLSVDQAIGPSPPRNLSNWVANSATFRRNHSTSIAACSISSFIL